MTTIATWPELADLRGWLALLDHQGDLRRLRGSIDGDQEVAAVLTRCDGVSAVLFEDVAGASFPLLGNTVSQRRHFAQAIRCADQDVVRRLAAAIGSPAPLAEVPVADAPVAEVQEDGPDLLSDLPLPVQHERDGGRYITSALLCVQDPRSGLTNLSINRLQVAGPRGGRAARPPAGRPPGGGGPLRGVPPHLRPGWPGAGARAEPAVPSRAADRADHPVRRA